MAKVKVKMNPGWEKALQEQVKASPEWKKIEQEVNDYLQRMYGEVNASMSGGDVAKIEAELSRRVKADAPTVTLPAGLLRSVAEKIAAGTFA